jgi:hypothetical protein
MMGRTPLERARTRSLERLCETAVGFRVGRCVHATLAPLPGAQPIPALAEWARSALFGAAEREDVSWSLRRRSVSLRT